MVSFAKWHVLFLLSFYRYDCLSFWEYFQNLAGKRLELTDDFTMLKVMVWVETLVT